MTPEETYLMAKESTPEMASGADKYLSQKRGIRFDYEKPGLANDAINMLRLFARGASGDVSEKAGAALGAAGVKHAEMMGAENNGIGSFGKEYENFLSHQNKSLEDFKSNHPIIGNTAELAGIASPGGVYSKAFEGLAKVPFISKLIGAGTFGKGLAASGLIGGAANTTYGLTRESGQPGITPKDIAINAAIDFPVGAATNMAAYSAGRAYDASKDAVKEWWGKKAEHLPFGLGKSIEAAKQKKFETDVTNFGKERGAENRVVAGRNATQEGADIQKEASDRYLKLKSSMLKKFGGSNVSAETLRQGIDAELGKITELASDLDPEAKAMKPILEKWQAKLFKNPTLSDLDSLTTTLYDLKSRPNASPAIGRLYKAARTNLMEAMDSAATSAGERAPAYKAAVKQSNKLADTQTDLMNEAKQPLIGERRLGEIKAAQTDVAGRQSDISNVIDALDSQNAQEGAAAREQYQAARQDIAKNLDVKEGPVGRLIKIGTGSATKEPLPSEVPIKARTIGELDNPEVVTKVLDVNQKYGSMMKKAVLGDLVESATNPESLARAMKKYKYTLPMLLSKEEVSTLNGLAGTKEAGPGFIERLTGKRGRDFVGVLTQAIAPMLTSDKGSDNGQKN